MQMEHLVDICEDMSVKMSWNRGIKRSEVHMNLLYEPPRQLEDIFSKKKPDKLAVIKNGYIYFENDRNSSKDLTFKGITKRCFRDKITDSKIVIIENKIREIDKEIETCNAHISKTKNFLNEQEKQLSELKSARKLLVNELKTLKDNQ